MEGLCSSTFLYCVEVEEMAAEIDAGIRVTLMVDADTLVAVVALATADDAWLDERLRLWRDWSTFERLPTMRDLDVLGSSSKPRTIRLERRESGKSPAATAEQRLLVLARGYS